MENSAHTLPRHAGFSLIELMVVVSIIAVLSTIAIPLFQSYQLRTRTAEVKTNLTAIRTAEESYYAEWGSYLAADPEPAVVPGSTPVVFNDKTTAVGTLGLKPEGRVVFSYGAARSAKSLRRSLPPRGASGAASGPSFSSGGVIANRPFRAPR
jgi:prepilin-type N-terminal cleavage/methylation domain-containing protein